MATIKKLDKGLYEVRYMYFDKDGKKHQPKRRFSRLSAAEEFKNEIEREIRDGTYVPAENIKFSDWIDDWFAAYKVIAELEPKTVEGYAFIISRLKAHFGAALVRKITPGDIEFLYLRMLNPAAAREKEIKLKLDPLTKRPLSASTVQRHHAVLSKAFKYAVRDGLIKSNPIQNVDRPRSSAQEVIPPDMDQVNAELGALHQSPYYLPVVIALMTGMRQSEVLGLKWQDIDLKSGELVIRRVRQRVGEKYIKENPPDGVRVKLVTVDGCKGIIEKERTKARHIRQITLPADLIAVLKAVQKQQRANKLRFGDKYAISDYVCVHEDGHLLDNSNLSRAVKRFRYHDLRHANASFLIQAGVPITEVARRLGHTTVTTTTNIYAHAYKTQDKAAAEAINTVVKLDQKPKLSNGCHGGPSE